MIVAAMFSDTPVRVDACTKVFGDALHVDEEHLVLADDDVVVQGDEGALRERLSAAAPDLDALFVMGYPRPGITVTCSSVAALWVRVGVRRAER